MAFNGNWDEIVLQELASLLSENVSIDLHCDGGNIYILSIIHLWLHHVSPPSLQQYSESLSHYHWSSFENKMLPHFLLPFLFLPFITHLCQMWCSLFHALSLKSRWLMRALLYVSVSQDAPYSENPGLVSGSGPGQWQAMTWSLPCKSSLNGMRLKCSSSQNCEVSPISQPVMTRSKAIAGPLMYFGPRPLLYLARLWVYHIATGNRPLPKCSMNVSFFLVSLCDGALPVFLSHLFPPT